MIFIISSISAFILPILNFKERCLTRDWGLFNSFSLFNHSCWRHYHKIPIHNPYILGGMDNFANPQSKVASPLEILDFLFPAPYGNLISLIILSIIGSYGFYFLMKFLKIENGIAILMSVIFIHASWFHLHFSEGHIIFGSFLLFGFIVLAILKFYENKFKLLFGVLCSFMILDGGMYAFIYSLILFVILHLFNVQDLSFIKLFKNLKQTWLFTLLTIFISFCLASFKLIPLLSLHGGRIPILENNTLNFKSLLYAFLYPFAHIELVIEGTNYKSFANFHEVGAYIGIVSFILILIYLFKNYRSQTLWKYIGVILLFLWIGSGWLDPVNPWRLFQKIPILNNAHVQSRALFFVYFFFLILLAFSLNWLNQFNKKWGISIGFFLVVEALFISIYPYYKIYKSDGSSMATNEFPKMIKNENITTTFLSPNASNWGFDFEHYNRHNAASKYFMDPSNRPTNVKAIEESGYKGESYFTKGQGKIEVQKYIPGEIQIKVNSETDSEIQLNTNYLLGWKSNKKIIKAFDKDGLLTVKIPKGIHQFQLVYLPNYLLICNLLTLIGVALSFLIFIKFFNRISVDQP